jgi:hypothetical protein
MNTPAIESCISSSAPHKESADKPTEPRPSSAQTGVADWPTSWFVRALLAPRLCCLRTAELTLNTLSHFDGQSLVVVEHRQRLSEREQVLGTVASLKRFRIVSSRLFNAAMTEPS